MKTVAGIVSIVGLLLTAPLQAAVCDGVSPVEASTLVSVVVETGLTGSPLLVAAPPGDKDRIFIVEQSGRVWVKQRGSALGVRSLYLDLSTVVTFGGERGLLGLDFSSDFATSGLFHVSYTRPGGATTLATYQQDSVNPNLANPTSVANFFLLAQPESNHNGGNIQVGSDGFIYLGLGDGGGSNDSSINHAVCGNGQSDATLLGKLIRIDPTGNSPNPPDCGTGSYTIPNGNPLADGPGGVCDEIWATGLRNPWRWTFDPANDDLYIGDVGQECWEEVNWVPGSSSGGENYGWRVMEGAHCFNPLDSTNCNSTGALCSGSPNCNDPSLTLPVFDTPQAGTGACSITGGYVYRGCRISNLQGHYFWGDYCNGRVNSFLMSGGVPTVHTDWSATVDPGSSLMFSLTSFGRDGEGELYAVDKGGSILKLIPPLSDFEVSGEGVFDSDVFRLSADADWSWEDLAYNSMHSILYYSVYRGTPNGIFDCIHSTTTTGWIGDAATPLPGGLFAYLVTATNQDAVETSGGTGRTLNNLCTVPPVQ